jgi:hypothetical protein
VFQTTRQIHCYTNAGSAAHSDSLLHDRLPCLCVFLTGHAARVHHMLPGSCGWPLRTIALPVCCRSRLLLCAMALICAHRNCTAAGHRHGQLKLHRQFASRHADGLRRCIKHLQYHNRTVPHLAWRPDASLGT